MSSIWLVVVVTGVATLAIKAAGPILLGGRPLPPRLDGAVSLLAPALLAALVAVNTFAVSTPEGQELVLDARVLGVAAAAVAIRLKAPVLVVVVIAAAVTAIARALTG
jgi:branched-subunit amino acid transport protein